MPISASDVNATFQRIHAEVRIGGQLASNLVSWEVSSGVRQINAAASLTFSRRPSGAQERETAEIWYYINGHGQPIFGGEVTAARWEHFPTRFVVECRDLLARVRLAWGAADREYSSQDDATIIRNLLEAMGIPSSAAHIESSAWTLGTVEPVVAKEGQPFQPLIAEIDDLAGYATFSRVGSIFRMRISGGTGIGSAWSYTQGSNIIRCVRQRTTDGMFNRAVVTGIDYEGLVIGGPGVAEASAPNAFIPNPPEFITERVQSNLIEDDPKAIEIAERKVADNNRRPETFELEVICNPLIYPLSVIDLAHSEVEAGSATLAVDRVVHRGDGGSARTIITTLGGQITPSDANIPPIAAFDVKLFQQAEDTGTAIESRIIVIADGSASNDPDGGTLTYAWVASVDVGTIAPTTGSAPVFRAVISGAATVLTIALTVNDGTDPTTISKDVPLSSANRYVEDLYSAETGLLAASRNGQISWNEWSVPGGGATCCAPFAAAEGQIWGAANGHIYATIDGLATAAVDLTAPHGAVACTAVWIHELDTSRIWAGFADGAVYQGTIAWATPSATWLARGTIAGGAVKEIREGVGTFGSLRATAGAGYYASEDSGATWSLLHTFDVAWRMAAGFELNLASGLNTTPPLFEEGGSTPTVPGGVTHLRGITFGWRVAALYATNNAAALYATAADGLFSSLLLHAHSLPAAGNHMIRSGNEDGVIYIACGDDVASDGGLVKWLPDAAAPWYVRRTGTRAVLMAGYGAAHLPRAAVDFVFVPMGESGANDAWHRYQDGVWTSGALPNSGWYWRSIKVDPNNTLRWLLLGFATNVTISGPSTAVYLSEDAGGSWASVSLSMPVGATATAEWVDLTWLDDGSYVIVSYDDTPINAPINWWTGSNASNATSHRNVDFNRLIAIAPDGLGGVLISDQDGPSGILDTLGRIVGSTASAVCLDYNGASNPSGPLSVRPGTTKAYMANVTGGGTGGLHELYPINAAPVGTDNVITGGSSVIWASSGQDALFVAVSLSGFTRIMWADLAASGVPGTPSAATFAPEHLIVGRTFGRVCVGYGQHMVADRRFTVYDGVSWVTIALPGTFAQLSGGRAVPYDVIGTSGTADLITP